MDEEPQVSVEVPVVIDSKLVNSKETTVSAQTEQDSNSRISRKSRKSRQKDAIGGDKTLPKPDDLNNSLTFFVGQQVKYLRTTTRKGTT